MNASPRQAFTRGRAVEFMAYNLLVAKGFSAILSAGTESPVDIIAWRGDTSLLLVKTERTRTKFPSPTDVSGYYARDISALRAMTVPPFAERHLWVWNIWQGWRFFEVLTGGICEVADV